MITSPTSARRLSVRIRAQATACAITPRIGVPTFQPTSGEAVAGTVLSNREREILPLLADGLVNKQTAARLGISTNKVKTHLDLLFDKLGVTPRAQAVATGVRRGLLLV